MSLAATTNKTSTSRKEEKAMKIKNTAISKIIAVTQSAWIRPALMTLALVVALIGITGCQPHH
jgi:hypothetical protein